MQIESRPEFFFFFLPVRQPKRQKKKSKKDTNKTPVSTPEHTTKQQRGQCKATLTIFSLGGVFKNQFACGQKGQTALDVFLKTLAGA